MTQVSRQELARSLAKHEPLVLRMVEPIVGPPPVEANIIVTPKVDEGSWATFKRRLVRGESPAAKMAAAAVTQAVERRVISALHGAPRLEAKGPGEAVMAAHLELDGLGCESMNRFGFLAPKAWDRLVETNSLFRMTPLLAPQTRAWERAIWVRQPLLEVQAVLFHRSALKAIAEARQPKRGQGAAATVFVRVEAPFKARVLAWGESG